MNCTEDILKMLHEVRPEANFADVEDFFARGILDSYDLTMLVSALEERFSIMIQGADLIPENFRNVDAIKALLSNYGAVQSVSN